MEDQCIEGIHQLINISYMKHVRTSRWLDYPNIDVHSDKFEVVEARSEL